MKFIKVSLIKQFYRLRTLQPFLRCFSIFVGSQRRTLFLQISTPKLVTVNGLSRMRAVTCRDTRAKLVPSRGRGGKKKKRRKRREAEFRDSSVPLVAGSGSGSYIARVCFLSLFYSPVPHHIARERQGGYSPGVGEMRRRKGEGGGGSSLGKSSVERGE